MCEALWKKRDGNEDTSNSSEPDPADGQYTDDEYYELLICVYVCERVNHPPAALYLSFSWPVPWASAAMKLSIPADFGFASMSKGCWPLMALCRLLCRLSEHAFPAEIKQLSECGNNMISGTHEIRMDSACMYNCMVGCALRLLVARQARAARRAPAALGDVGLPLTVQLR